MESNWSKPTSSRSTRRLPAEAAPASQPAASDLLEAPFGSRKPAAGNPGTPFPEQGSPTEARHFAEKTRPGIRLPSRPENRCQDRKGIRRQDWTEIRCPGSSEIRFRHRPENRFLEILQPEIVRARRTRGPPARLAGSEVTRLHSGCSGLG